MSTNVEIPPYTEVLGKYLLYSGPGGGVIFDPVSLESASLSTEETRRLRAEDQDLIAELEQFGFDREPRSLPQRDAVLARIRELGLTGKPPRISGYRVVLTDTCNMKCTYCFVDTNTGADDMTEADLRAGLEYLFEQNAGNREVTIQWFGGEPTVRFDLMKYGDVYARELAAKYDVGRVQSTLVTNGVLLTEEMIAHFKKYSYGVGVSFDGTPEDNVIERFLLSGKPADPRIHKNIQRLRTAGVYVGCNLTPTPANVSRLPQSVSYVLSLGIDFIYVNTPIPISGKWHVDGEALASAVFTSRLLALSRGAMLFSALDRVYQALDTRVPKAYEHIQGDGGLNAALLPRGRVSVLDLNWRDDQFVFPISELRENPALLELAGKQLLPSQECVTCPAAAVCGGPTRNEVSLRKNPEPDAEMCAFFRRGLQLALTDQTGLQ
ncbi:radical SAM protein [Streptomyces sp. NPDC006967]|uniref:radical SAM protein n=1 Tax=Streptomyces sp. NPDC006967 TaxID=3156906 RepID=UPI0033C04CB6